MKGNVFFKQRGRTFYGPQFGDCIEYMQSRLCGYEYIQFGPDMIMSEDPQNTHRPEAIDLVSECLWEIAQKQNHVMGEIYGRLFPVESKDTVAEIKARIRNLQLSMIHIDASLTSDVRKHIQRGLEELVKNMPVH